MPARSAAVALGAAPLYLVDALACLEASALKCGPLSHWLASQVWPSFTLLDSSPRWSGLSATASPGLAAVQCADAQLQSSTVALCRASSVKHMMIMRQYFSRLWYDPYQLHACSLGLCFLFLVRWSVMCYQDGWFMVCQRCIDPRVSQSQFGQPLLGRTLGLFGTFHTIGGGYH